jgi:hypothetical protein
MHLVKIKEETMNRYFVVWTAVGLLLAFGGEARGQTVNLDLLIDGPFGVCENSTNRTLTIYIPNLGGTAVTPNPSYKHFIPGLSTDWSNLPLGNGSAYPSYSSSSTYTLITGEQAGSMKVKPSGSTTVALYHEKYNGTCANFDQTIASVSLNVPDPDEVWPLETDQVFSYVTDSKTGSFTGPSQCRTVNGCRHASKVVLRYLDVDLGNVKISNSSGCIWCPASSTVMGSEYTLTLDVLPDPSVNSLFSNEQQAEDSFARASALFNKLLSVQPALKVVTNINVTEHFPFNAVTHAACHVPLIFYCQSGTACQ